MNLILTAVSPSSMQSPSSIQSPSSLQSPSSTILPIPGDIDTDTPEPLALVILIAIGMLEELASVNISFLEWMAYCLPISTVFLGVLFILTNIEIKKYKIVLLVWFIASELTSLQ